MEGAPRLEILLHIDAFAIRPRLGIEILDQRSRRSTDNTAILAAEDQATDLRPGIAIERRRQQIFKRNFAFAYDYEIEAEPEPPPLVAEPSSARRPRALTASR